MGKVFSTYKSLLDCSRLIGPSSKGLMLQAPNVKTKKTLGDRAYMCAAPKFKNNLPYHVRNENNFKFNFAGLTLLV